jgi:hypothetical protein
MLSQIVEIKDNPDLSAEFTCLNTNTNPKG